MTHKDQFKTAIKAAGLTVPEVLTIAITDQCNYRCPHCWVDTETPHNKRFVPHKEIKKIIRTFAILGGQAIRLTGGEPLLHPNINELIKFIAAQGLGVLLQTNGSLLDTNHLTTLKEIEALSIQISLDGATASTHDSIRGPGSFSKIINTLKLLIAANMNNSVTLFLTEMQHNLDELPDLMALAKKLDIHSVHSGTIVLCGRAKTQQLVKPASAAQYSQLLKRYIYEREFRALYDEIGTIAIIEWYKHGLKPSPCDFIKNPYLTTTGILYPCLMCHIKPYSVSDVFKKGLEKSFLEGIKMWGELSSIRNNKEALPDICRNCPIVEQCAGGCLGRTWGSSGTIFSPEDRCIQRKTVLKWKNNQRAPIGN